MRHLPIAFLSLLVLFPCGMVQSQELDARLLQSWHADRNVQLDPAFRFVTKTTSPLAILCPSAVFGTGFLTMNRSLKNKGLYIAQSMFVNAAITLGLKYSIQRQRPFETHEDIRPLAPAGSPSFPSAHTSNAFAAATSMTMALPRWYVAAPAFAWAATVGYSRIHLGVHYPSDVATGAIVGAGSAFLCAWLNRKLFHSPQAPKNY